MKILIVSTSSGSRGGGELSLLYLARALAQRGHAVMLWCSTHPRMDELAAAFAGIGEVHRSDYVNTYDRRGRSLASWLDGATARRAAEQWRALAPDVIHLNKQNLEDGLDLVAAASRCGLPSLCMIHITQTARYLRAVLAGPRDFVSRRALRAFPGMFATTPESRVRDLAEFLGDGARVRMVPNGVPIPETAKLAAARQPKRAELGIADGELLCVAVGRMVPQKRPLLFLEIAERIHRSLPHTRFLWVGDGALTGEWDAWVAARNLGHAIRRLPWQSDAAGLLAAADVFLHVAEFEGLAFAILEALAAGLPCAITPNLLAEMPFLDAANSIAIDDGDAWMHTLRDPARLSAIGRAARRLAEDRFSFARMAEDYEVLYRQALLARP